jgi:hypothetical protein
LESGAVLVSRRERRKIPELREGAIRIASEGQDRPVGYRISMDQDSEYVFVGGTTTKDPNPSSTLLVRFCPSIASE